MVALAETDLTVAITRRESINGVKKHYGTITFGDGALTYVTGGVPLTKEKLGFARVVLSFDPERTTTFYEAAYDKTNEKLIMAYDDDASADGAQIQVANTVAPAATVVHFVATGY
ncbi:MAG: hypothetical protein GY861_08350 [bacterium]|nr:hypothetical protein [bacterium]